MKKFSAIMLAVLLMMLMVVPVFADEEVTASASAGTFSAEDGMISGGYESDGLVNIYVDDELAGGDTLNVAADAGEHTVKVYENGVLVKEETVIVGATEEPGTDEPVVDPGQTDPGTVEPTQQDNPTVTTTTPATTTNTTKTASNVPKTGDAENMGTFMVLGLGAALTLAAAKRVKSR